MDLQSELFAGMVEGARFLLLMVASYNMAWSFKWIKRLLTGEGWPLTPLKSAIFMVSLGSVVLQIAVLSGADSGADSAFALLGFIALLAGHLGFAIAHQSNWASAFEQNQKLLRHANHTVVMAELAEFDPEQADRMRAEAVRILKEKVFQ